MGAQFPVYPMEVLKDKVLCSALVDRLCKKSYLVNMTGTSYRTPQSLKKTHKTASSSESILNIFALSLHRQIKKHQIL